MGRSRQILTRESKKGLAKHNMQRYTMVHKVSLRGWVQFPTGGDVWRHTSPRPAMVTSRLNRCDSDTNSTVWMEEEHGNGLAVCMKMRDVSGRVA